MVDYQRKKKNPYLLPPTLYKRVLAIIRDYPRRKEEYDMILDQSPAFDAAPRNQSGVGDSTANKAVKRAEISKEINAVERALLEVPPEYREGIIENINYPRSGYPDDADRVTYCRWRQKYLYGVAVKLGLN